MAYGDDQPKSLGAKALGVATVAAIGIAAKFGAFGGVSSWFYARTPDQRFDAAVSSDPRSGAIFTELRSSFPQEYDAMKRRFVAQAARRSDDSAMRSLAKAEMSQFIRAHMADIAQAPAADMAAFRSTQLATYENLQRASPTICGQMFMGTYNATIAPPAAVMDAMMPYTLAQVRMAGSGARAAASRSTSLRPADVDALVADMRRAGATDADITAFGQLEAAAPATQCRVAVFLSRALTTLPPAQADRTLAAIMVLAES
jgi:hypothetical protein